MLPISPIKYIYLPFFILAYIEKYSLGTLDDFFLPEYAEMFEYLFNGDYSGSYINNLLPPSSSTINELYDMHKSDDGFLYITYTNENTLTINLAAAESGVAYLN